MAARSPVLVETKRPLNTRDVRDIAAAALLGLRATARQAP
jgi:hypothetical protein